jgi:hypothetical protein
VKSDRHSAGVGHAMRCHVAGLVGERAEQGTKSAGTSQAQKCLTFMHRTGTIYQSSYSMELFLYRAVRSSCPRTQKWSVMRDPPSVLSMDKPQFVAVNRRSRSSACASHIAEDGWNFFTSPVSETVGTCRIRIRSEPRSSLARSKFFVFFSSCILPVW